jgi:hypothetical protein
MLVNQVDWIKIVDVFQECFFDFHLTNLVSFRMICNEIAWSLSFTQMDHHLLPFIFTIPQTHYSSELYFMILLKLNW